MLHTPSMNGPAEDAAQPPQAHQQSDPDHAHPSARTPLTQVSEYLSVKEAALLLGVSERTIYGYIETGKMPASRIGSMTVIETERVRTYQRHAPGRLRTRTPRWHIPPDSNQLFLTYVTVRLRPGQNEHLVEKLLEIRALDRHLFPGTATRYIARNQHDPEELQIVLFWRGALRPPEDQRQEALAALATDLAELVEWEQAIVQERDVLLHA